MFLFLSSDTTCHTCPLHTRTDPRGNTVTKPASPAERERGSGSMLLSGVRVSSWSLGCQTETRRDVATRPSTYRSLALPRRDERWRVAKRQRSLDDNFTRVQSAITSTLTENDRLRDQDRGVLDTRARRRFDLIARRVQGDPRARPLAHLLGDGVLFTRVAPRLHLARRAYRARSTYTRAYRLDEESKRRRRRWPGRIEEERRAHTRVWFQ